MAKARILTKGGATIDLEGTADEIASLIAKLDVGDPVGSQIEKPRAHALAKRETSKAKAKPKRGLAALVSELVEDGFFAKPKTFTEVGDRLKQGGHYYPRTSLSPVILKLTKVGLCDA